MLSFAGRDGSKVLPGEEEDEFEEESHVVQEVVAAVEGE